MHKIEISLPVLVARPEPLWARINRKLPPKNDPAIPVSKQDGHDVKSGAIDCQIHVAILIEIAGHEQFGRDDAAGSMVSQSRWQKRDGENHASPSKELFLFHNFYPLLLLVNLDLTNL